MPLISLPMVTGEQIESSKEQAVGKGNSKLGSKIGTFSIPAIHTCSLGSTPTCRSLCYACSATGFFMMSSVVKRYQSNLAFSHRPQFSDSMVAQIKRKNLVAFRWHVAGDMYSPEYAAKLLSIMVRTPEVKHFLFTRTWRTERMRSVLSQISSLPQVQMWLSCDKDTGEPVKISKSRRAYMQVSDADIPSYPVDLVFRDSAVRKSIVKRIAGAMVCPVENGTTKTTCEKCKTCFSPPRMSTSFRL